MTNKVFWKQKDKGEKDQRLNEGTPVESSKASTSVCGELEEEVVAHLFFISIFFCFSYLSYRTLRLKGCKAWIFKGWKLSHSLVPLHFLVEEGKFWRWCAGWDKMKVIFVFVCLYSQLYLDNL